MKTKEELNAKLSEEELSQVNGGQAVLPLLSSEAPEAGEATLVGAGKIILCSGCGQVLECPKGDKRHGTVTCSCGTVNSY